MAGLRVLITGFGAFPGAPFNPTIPLVRQLARLRRPALSDVELSSHIFDVTYATVDRELPHLIARHRPHALLMFGLASRTRFLRIETRARNAVTQLWPDAANTRVRQGMIQRDGDALSFGPHTSRLLRAAASSGVDARLSRNAGSYLCNYLSWRAIEACSRDDGPALAAFVHVPLVARPGVARRAGSPYRMTMDDLVDAGEAVLMEMVKQSRRAGQMRSIAASTAFAISAVPSVPPISNGRKPPA